MAGAAAGAAQPVYAGLGGFHIALSRLGHKCVFASDIDPTLCQLYKQNHGMIPAGDIREIEFNGSSAPCLQVDEHQTLFRA